MRADREVCMDETYYYDAPDRFWSIEVSFPPALDEAFGVTNNKQDVPHFKELCRELARRGDDPRSVSMLDAGDIDQDHGFAELESVAKYVLTQSRTMRNLNKVEHKSRRHNANKRVGRAATPTVNTTLRVKEELGESEPTPGEREAKRDEMLPPAEREQAQRDRADRAKESAIGQGVSNEDAEALANSYIKGMKYQVIEVRQEQAASFFWPDEYGDLQVVYLNTGHPAHEALLDTLRLEDDKIRALTEDEAKLLLGVASDALGWLIHGWVRMEDLNKDNAPVRNQIVDVRELWGKQLRIMVQSRSFASPQEALKAVLRDEEDA